MKHKARENAVSSDIKEKIKLPKAPTKNCKVVSKADAAPKLL